MQVRLTTPLTRQELAPLHAGDTVLLTGTVYTARDAAHARMNEALDRGEPLPFDIKGAAIYYVGPTPERPGCAIGAAGPTTSGRMDKFTPRLLDLGLACMIGKGKRDEAVKAAVVRKAARSSPGRTLGARLSAAWKWWICPLPFCWMPMAATCTSPARRHTCKA